MRADEAAETLKHIFSAGPCRGRAVLLTGPWGSGKTFLWKNMVAPEIERPSLYISAFGAESASALKTRFLAGTVVNVVGRSGLDKAASVRGAAAKIKDGAGRMGKGLASILSAAGGSLLKKVDVDPLQLFEFADPNTVICIDDVERISPQFSMRDLLAVSNLLTEHGGFDVLLISNEEQIGEGDEKAREAYLRYKEKVVHRDVHLQADIPSIFERVLATVVGPEKARSHIRSGRDVILDTFARAKEENIRILARVFSSIELLTSFDVGEALGAHLRILCSFTILAAHAELKDRAFYAFEPLAVRVAAQMESRTPHEETKERHAFLDRFFGEADYSYDDGIYRLVREGEVDAAYFRNLARPRPAKAEGERVYEEVSAGAWLHWSEIDVSALIERGVGALLSDPNLPAQSVLKLLAYMRFLGGIIQKDLPSGLGRTIVENLMKRIAEDNQSDVHNLGRAWKIHMDELGDLVKDEALAVQAAVSMARRAHVRDELFKAIAQRDGISFQRLLKKDFVACSEILFDESGLDRIWEESEKGASEFFSDAVQLLLHDLHEHPPDAITASRRQALVSRLSHTASASGDRMQRWRVSKILSRE